MKRIWFFSAIIFGGFLLVNSTTAQSKNMSNMAAELVEPILAKGDEFKIAVAQIDRSKSKKGFN